MTRRVELDLLEIDGAAQTPKTETAGGGAEAGLSPPASSSPLSRLPAWLRKILSRLPAAPGGRPALLNWKVIAAGLAAAVFLSGAVASFLAVRHQEAERAAAGEQARAVAAVPAVREADFPGFSIDIKDAGGRYRFLQCDVTIEFHEVVELSEDRKVEIRRAIYLAAKKKGPEWIAGPDSGRRFKNDVREQLRGLLGEGALKDVYVTRYVLI